MEKLTLRSYQKTALDSSMEALQRGVTRQLIQMPTGTGKTCVFAALPEYFSFKKKILVLVHREELAEQARDKIARWNADIKIGIEMANSYSNGQQIIIASVPTIGRDGSDRIKKFNPNEFDAVITDECHHSTADSYQRVYRYFNLMAPDCKVLSIGFTATVNRSDNQALAQAFDEIVYEMNTLDAIQTGWLADIKGFRIKTNADLSKIHTIAGDFNQGELSNAVNTPARNAIVVQSWLKHASDRKTIVFTVDIAHAKDLAETFRSYGIKAEAIWGNDPDRTNKLVDHKAGKLQILCNCGVLTEGYDDWTISCIVQARPTKSQLLYQQQIGRGLRIPNDINNILEADAAGIPVKKRDCILIDAVDNTGRHSLVTLSTIFGLPPLLDTKGRTVTEAKEKIEAALVERPQAAEKLQTLKSLDQIPEMLESVNLFQIKFPEEVLANSSMIWVKLSDEHYLLTLPSKEQCFIKRNMLDRWDAKVVCNDNHVHNTFSELQGAFRFVESMVASLGKEFLGLLRRNAKWTGDPATEPQLVLLRKFYGPRVPSNLTKGEARTLINDFITRKRAKL